MISEHLTVSRRLQHLYRGGSPPPSFDDIIADVTIEGDETLADLIEADGRRRVQLGLDVTLDRYLAAVTDLADRPEALDAAIDMALRAATAGERSRGTDPVEDLVRAYPQFEVAIRECATLNNAIWSTARVRDEFSQLSNRALPCDFGPRLEDGRYRYELTELLGEGAFGRVYLAVDRQLSEPDHPALVSIKVVPGLGTDAADRAQLVEEATKARRIDHPNVVRVMDRGTSEQDEHFIVSEYVSGGDLGRKIRRRGGPMEIREAVRVASAIARGVHAAHMAGLVHCDLKPNNIVLTEDGVPKVADFGIAIRANAGAREPIERSEPLGNLAFMSPEQFRMEPGALTIPTDLYALGGMLYWLLTGALPNGATPEEIRRVHDPRSGRVAPPSPAEVRREIEPELDAICLRAMAVRSSDRYGSAAHFSDELDMWLRSEPIPWTRPSVFRRTRLWIRRAPALAAAVFIVAALTAWGAVAAWRVAAKEQARRDSVEMVLGAIDVGTQVRERNLRYEVLPDMWLWEWVLGPSVLAATDAERIEFWDRRKQIIRDQLAYARETNRAHHASALQWTTALGFWHCVDGEYEQADPLLRKALADWTPRLADDDDLLVNIRAMIACNEVSRLADMPTMDATARRASLRGLLPALTASDYLLQAHAPWSPIHRLVLDRLVMVYGEEMLDDLAALTEVLDRLRPPPPEESEEAPDGA